MKTGIVDVGGGLRGIYAAGVFDCCLDKGIRFDLGIGVSAGSANIASFLAGQRGRNYLFFTEYPFRKEYMSAGNFLRTRSYLDMDYIYGTLSNSDGENPLDYDAIMRNPTEMLIVACNAVTGETRYFDKHELARDRYDAFKASSSIPMICRPYPIDGQLYYDGALGDTVPFEKAFALGCDKVVLVLTKPRDYLRTAKKDRILAKGIRREFPEAAKRLESRAQRYNDSVALAREYEAKGRLLIVAPDDTCGVDTLTRDRASLQMLYDKGLYDGERIESFLAE